MNTDNFWVTAMTGKPTMIEHLRVLDSRMERLAGIASRRVEIKALLDRNEAKTVNRFIPYRSARMILP